MGRLEGKASIVTGGASGIGLAIAAAFASEGAAVAILDIDAEAAAEGARMIEANGGTALGLRADVSSSADVDAAIEQCVVAFSRLDVLVNNAGVACMGTVLDLEEESWDLTMAVNLKSIFLCSRRAIPHMMRAGGGRIINTASAAGLVASAGRPAYCASKGGVVMLTRAMALDCAPLGINVNAICPGMVITGMTRGSLRDPVVLQEKLAKTPLGRLALPEDIAPAAVYLASPESSFVTGSCLVVDGGWSID